MKSSFVLVNDGLGHSPRYFKTLGLGIFWECVSRLEEARRFATRSSAAGLMQSAGKHREGWRVVKVDA